MALIAIAYTAVCAYLWWQQRALIFNPEAAVTHTPDEAGIAFRELAIPVLGDGVLDAWWLPATSASPNAATVLYLRGNDGNLGREVARLAALHRQGLPILAVDYRGFGRSSGPAPSEARVYEDATEAWDYLVGEKGIAPRHLILYGHSLGAAVAVELALRRPTACAVVLESAFTSMADMARREYPLIPADWLLNQRFDTASKVARLELPIVLVHGVADEIVPVSMSRQLYGSARTIERS